MEKDSQAQGFSAAINTTDNILNHDEIHESDAVELSHAEE